MATAREPPACQREDVDGAAFAVLVERVLDPDLPAGVAEDADGALDEGGVRLVEQVVDPAPASHQASTETRISSTVTDPSRALQRDVLEPTALRRRDLGWLTRAFGGEVLLAHRLADADLAQECARRGRSSMRSMMTGGAHLPVIWRSATDPARPRISQTSATPSLRPADDRRNARTGRIGRIQRCHRRMGRIRASPSLAVRIATVTPKSARKGCPRLVRRAGLGCRRSAPVRTEETRATREGRARSVRLELLGRVDVAAQGRPVASGGELGLAGPRRRHCGRRSGRTPNRPAWPRCPRRTSR